MSFTYHAPRCFLLLTLYTLYATGIFPGRWQWRRGWGLGWRWWWPGATRQRRIRVIIAAASRTRVHVLPCAWHLEVHDGMVPLKARVHAHGFPILLAFMYGPAPLLVMVRAHNAVTHIAFMFTRNGPQWMLLFNNPKRGWQAGMSTRSADFPGITGQQTGNNVLAEGCGWSFTHVVIMKSLLDNSSIYHRDLEQVQELFYPPLHGLVTVTR